MHVDPCALSKRIENKLRFRRMFNYFCPERRLQLHLDGIRRSNLNFMLQAVRSSLSRWVEKVAACKGRKACKASAEQWGVSSFCLSMAMEAGLVLSLCDEDGSLVLSPVDCGSFRTAFWIFVDSALKRCGLKFDVSEMFVEDLWMHPALLAAAAEADKFKLTSILFFG